MTTSEPVTKEYVDDFLSRNDSILLSGKCSESYRIFTLKKAGRTSYEYIAGKCDITASATRQLLSEKRPTQQVTWELLRGTYSEIRHVFPTVFDLVE